MSSLTTIRFGGVEDGNLFYVGEVRGRPYKLILYEDGKCFAHYLPGQLERAASASNQCFGDGPPLSPEDFRELLVTMLRVQREQQQ